MTPKFSDVDIISLLVIAVTVVIGTLLWPRLPTQVPIHFSASGTPGNYVPRTVAVLAMPIVMTATAIVLKGVARIDPPEDTRKYDTIICSTMCLFFVGHLFTLGSSIGYSLPFGILPVTTTIWTVFVVYLAVKLEGVVR